MPHSPTPGAPRTRPRLRLHRAPAPRRGQVAHATIVLRPRRRSWCAFFGSRHRGPVRRQFATLYLEFARKAATSSRTAIALYHLLREETGASVVCGNSTAGLGIVLRIMQRMIRAPAWLRDDGLTVYAHAIARDATAARRAHRREGGHAGRARPVPPSCWTGIARAGLRPARRPRSRPGCAAGPAPAGANHGRLQPAERRLRAARHPCQGTAERVRERRAARRDLHGRARRTTARPRACRSRRSPMIGTSPTSIGPAVSPTRSDPAWRGNPRRGVRPSGCRSASSSLSMTASGRVRRSDADAEAFAGEPCWMTTTSRRSMTSPPWPPVRRDGWCTRRRSLCRDRRRGARPEDSRLSGVGGHRPAHAHRRQHDRLRAHQRDIHADRNGSTSATSCSTSRERAARRRPVERRPTGAR